MKPTTIIFDFFGVFVPDIYNAWSKGNLSSEEAVRIRKEVMDKVDLDQIDKDSFFDLLCNAAGQDRVHVEEEWGKITVLNEPLLDVVRQLKEQYTIVLCSTAATWEIYPMLEQFELTKLFDRIFISAEMQLVKPNADYFAHVLAELSIVPGEAVFTDDNPENIHAAQTLGISGIQFVDTEQLRSSLQQQSIL